MLSNVSFLDLQLCQVGAQRPRPALAGIDFTTSISTISYPHLFLLLLNVIPNCFFLRNTVSFPQSPQFPIPSCFFLRNTVSSASKCYSTFYPAVFSLCNVSSVSQCVTCCTRMDSTHFCVFWFVFSVLVFRNGTNIFL